jgi:hypothetical protein
MSFNLPPRYVLFFIPETSTYALWDRLNPPPMRKIHPEDIICYCDSYERANEVFTALTEMDLI